MADKKRKPSAKNLYKSSRDKLVKEFVENSYPDDTKSEQSTLRQGLKGNASKAIKKAIKSKKPEGSILKKTPMQAALTGSPNKAVKELIKDRFEKAQEAQKALNKEYRKELGKLRRRIGYFEGKGFQFDNDRIVPNFDGNATQEEIDYLKAIRGKVLKRMATGFEPPLVETDEVPVDEIVEATDGVIDEPRAEEMAETEETTDFTSDEALTGSSGYDYDEPSETPEERYYRENTDRVHDDNGAMSEGELILQQIYSDINSEWDTICGILAEDINDEEVAEFANRKYGASQDLLQMLEEAEERLGRERLAQIIEENAETIKQCVQQILFDLYVSSGRDYDDVMTDTDASLLAVSSILNADSPQALMRQAWGDIDQS